MPAPDQVAGLDKGGDTSTTTLPKDSAAGAWEVLAPQLTTALGRSDRGLAVDWKQVARDAQAFRVLFPSDSKVRAAAKLEVLAGIRAQDDAPVLSAETEQSVRAYLADHQNGVRDRLDVTIVFAQAGLKRGHYKDREAALTAHEAHARELIKEFPGEPEGYGYLLAMAKASSAKKGRQLAEELLVGPLPTSLRSQVERLIARAAMEGRRLELNEVSEALLAANGRVLFIYTWTEKDEGVIDLVKRLQGLGDFRFVGVALDPDVAAAKRAAAHLQLPGGQIYDGGGLDGPVARQLQLTMTASLYLIGPDGVVEDVNAHRSAEATLIRIAAKEEGRP